MRVLPRLLVSMALVAGVIAPLSSQSALPTRLVYQSDLSYLGAFDLPDATGAGDRACFEYQYPGAMGYNPATHSLIVVGHDWDQWVGEVNIPASLGGTATVRQPCRDILYGKRSQIPGTGNPVKIGGFLARGNSLLVSGFPYYANGTADGTHWSRSTTFTDATVRDVVRVGNTPSGTIGGYMAHIPAAWRTALKGDMLTGQCCISIISRSSYGPSVSSAWFDDVLTQTRPNATTLLNYTASNPLAPYGSSTASPLWNGFTRIRGVALPEGTASVLFFGRHGTGPWCYGTGPACGDPIYQEQGEHAYPYRAQVWAYSAHDLAQVAAGQRAAHSIQPYAVWALPGFGGSEVAGAAIDRDGRLYVLENGGGPGARGRVHVYSISGSAATAPGDTTAPSVSVSSPANGATLSGTVTLSATASDNVGVASVWFTVDGTVVGAEDTSAPFQVSWNTASVANGTHTVRAMARDAAGNTATSGTIAVTVNNTSASNDTSAPTVSITSPGNGATVSGTVSVSAAASDNVGVSSVQFTLNGVNLGSADTTAPYSISWNTAGAANGTHMLRAIARDAAGNSTTSSAIAVTVNNAATSNDTTAPTVSLTSPAAGSTVSGTITISANASDNVGVTSVQFTLNGANLGAPDTTSPYSIGWNTATVANGRYVLRAVARDAAGNTRTSTSRTVTVSNAVRDVTAPTVSLTAPAAGATVQGTVAVSASASDDVGVASVQFTLNGINLGSPDTVAPYAISWNTASAANGSHVLRAIARDAAGNVTASATRTVVVNNGVASSAPPTVAPSTCSTPDPFVAMGGGVCYNGGWLPPGMTPPAASIAPPSNVPSLPTTPSVPSTPASCVTSDPFAAMGGGTCFNGGWLPPGMVPPASVAPLPPVTAPPSAPALTGCLTPSPGVGWTCVGGGWLPPNYPR
jgi:hypothetical protein